MQLRYDNVCIESFGYELPDEMVTTAELERRLAPLYERLRLPTGRLELMTGIRERRFFPRGMFPSEASVRTARRALDAAGVAPIEVGLLIHGSVCRDFLEPATACGVHRELGLPHECTVYDVSNACLGLLNAVTQAADAIELGRIQAAVIVGTENGRDLVENTIERLNEDESLTRDNVKRSIASLTIGAASAAIVLTHRSRSRSQNRLLGGTIYADTSHHELCRSGSDEARADGVRPLMSTDSEALLSAGIGAAGNAFRRFTQNLGIAPVDIDTTICHQVGIAHKKLIFQALGLEPGGDFSTFEFLGNTGSAALPATAALAAERGHLRPGDLTALLGIGSGVNVVMLGVEWATAPVAAGNIGGGHGSETVIKRVGPLVAEGRPVNNPV